VAGDWHARCSKATKRVVKLRRFRRRATKGGSESIVIVPGKRYAVFSIRQKEGGPTIWSRAGFAFGNKDGSLNVWLDVLPISGRLHVREMAQKEEVAPGAVSEPAPQQEQQPEPLMAAEGH
jgi:hypothetical protein